MLVDAVRGDGGAHEGNAEAGSIGSAGGGVGFGSCEENLSKDRTGGVVGDRESKVV